MYTHNNDEFEAENGHDVKTEGMVMVNIIMNMEKTTIMMNMKANKCDDKSMVI